MIDFDDDPWRPPVHQEGDLVFFGHIVEDRTWTPVKLLARRAPDGRVLLSGYDAPLVLPDGAQLSYDFPDDL